MARIIPFVFILVSVVSGYGQNLASNCPVITVVGPTGVTTTGARMAFRVGLSGPQIIGKPDYDWTVSGGPIASGQGTNSITVDTTEEDRGKFITAKVAVKSVAPGCSNSAYESAPVGTGIGCNFPLDQYEKIPLDEEKARLDNGMIQFNNNPNVQLFIYLGLKPEESFDGARQHASKIIHHFLSRDEAFDVSRVQFVVYIDDRHVTILDLVPAGGTSRRCDTGCIQFPATELIRK